MAKKSLFSFLIMTSLSLSWALPVPAASRLDAAAGQGGDAMEWMLPSVQPNGHMEVASNKRPRPEPHKCLALAKEIGASRVWWGRHVGAKELRDDDDFFNWGPKKEAFDKIGCFRNRKDCENWLYWMRTDYPLFYRANPCRRGL